VEAVWIFSAGRAQARAAQERQHRGDPPVGTTVRGTPPVSDSVLASR
jgi:hypothetical protein